jgi:hypothetical protein
MPDDEDKTLIVANNVKNSGIEVAVISLGTDGIDQGYLNRLTPVNFSIDVKEGSKGITEGLNSILTLSSPAGGQPGGGFANSLGGLYEEK